MTRLILLTIILVAVPAQAQETYRLPAGRLPINYLNELHIGDTSRQLSESERRGLVELLVKSYIVSVREYGQDYILEDGSTPLIAAIEGKSLETVKLLINAGADVNAKNDNGWPPLNSALLFGCTDIIKALEEAGAKQ